MKPDPYKYFRIEARELLDQLGRAALDLENRGGGDNLAQLLRLAHTLKGAARVVKQAEIADRAHAIETVLQPLRGKDEPAKREVVNELFAHLDRISAQLAALPSDTPASAEVPEVEVPSGARAGREEVDSLVESLVESHVRLAGLRERFGGESELRRLLDRLSAPGSAPLPDQLSEAFDGMTRETLSELDRVERELQQALEAAEQIRLVPVSSVFVLLERAVRDAAQALHKRAQFSGRGGAVRLDAEMLNVLQSALLQIVRNAVAHGIEDEGTRRASGKAAEGRVSIEVTRRGQTIQFVCADDGRGIDFEAVRRVAGQRGAARDFDESQLMNVLLQGGISTSTGLSEVAGRGIGLDVVRDALQKLGGEVHVETRTGQGTSFILSVPLSRALIRGLCVEADGRQAVLPLEAVRATLRITADDVLHTPQGESLMYGDRQLPLLPLHNLLDPGKAFARSARNYSAVILSDGDQGAALCIDHLAGLRSCVFRPLPALAPADPVIGGVALDAQGNPQLLLDPQKLIERALAGGTPVAVEARAAPLILVIDDSLTTRMLERSILESAGYAVDTADSGEEAMEKARNKDYALFLVDVEMPGMDGFSFVEKTRADPTLRDIPCILVTSRASPEDLRRGKQAGAYAHIDKGRFEQGELLRRTREVLR